MDTEKNQKYLQSAEEDDDAGMIKAQTHFAGKDQLGRSLVGYFAGKEDTPTRNIDDGHNKLRKEHRELWFTTWMD